MHILLNTLKYYVKFGRQNDRDRQERKTKVSNAGHKLAEKQRKRGQKSRVSAREMQKAAKLGEDRTVRTVRRWMTGVVRHRKHMRGQPNHEITPEQSQAMYGAEKYRL